MPAIQTNYTTNIPSKKAGHVPEMEQADLISRTVENTDGIAFGTAVAQGTNDKGCIPFAGTGFLGVATRDRSVLVGEKFSRYESARILRKGPITVVASVAVSAGDPVAVTAAGAFTNVATGNTAIPNSRWETSAGVGALADIFIK